MKPRAICDFEREYHEWEYAGRYVPEHVRVVTRFRDDSANSLTKFIIAFLRMRGAFACRVNTVGVYRKDRGRFVRTTQRRGMPDITATYRGMSLGIEVKVGNDKLSRDQEQVRKEIVAAGGHYHVARDFEDFKEWFNRL